MNDEMFDRYEDDPQQLLSYMASMSPAERAVFDKGYVAALYQVVDQLNDSQRKLLAKMLGAIDDEEVLEQLKSRMLLLDIYEKHYKSKIKHLSIRHLQT